MRFIPSLTLALIGIGVAASAMPAAAQVTTASSLTSTSSAGSSSTALTTTTTMTTMTTKRVMVQPLKINDSIASAAPGLGATFSEMLTTALLARGVRIVERQQLDALETEKKLGSNVLDTNSAQKTGRIKGASIAVVGTITEFGVRDVKKGGGAVLGAILGGAMKQSELRIKVDAHLVDIATGDIVAGSQVVQEGKQVDTSWAGGVGILFKGLPIGGLVGGSSNEWLEGKAGKAARKVVEEIADKIASQIPKSAAGAEEEETREVEVAGFDDFTDADAFVKALGKVPGVVNVEATDFSDGVQKMTVTASVKTLKNLPTLLSTDINLKAFGFKVSGINKERIQLKKKSLSK